MAAKRQNSAATPKPKETWTVVVVYEDTTTRERAMAVCDQLVKRFWSKVEFEFSWWRQTYLADSNIAKAAAWSAANADLIVFSTHSDSELSAGLKAWVETWLEKRREREGALIGLIGTARDPKTDTASKHRYLRQIAERARMDYLSTELSAAPEAIADSIESIHQRADQITSVLDEILSHTPLHPSPPRRSTDG